HPEAFCPHSAPPVRVRLDRLRLREHHAGGTAAARPELPELPAQLLHPDVPQRPAARVRRAESRVRARPEARTPPEELRRALHRLPRRRLPPLRLRPLVRL